MVTDFTHPDNLPAYIDRRLWIKVHCDDGRHYLVGNPHTFRGRISAWCSNLSCEITISKSDILNSSPEAGIWIDGYLRGNEPPPPAFPDEVVGDIEQAEADWKQAEKDWYERRREFAVTGVWPDSGETDDSETDDADQNRQG